MSEREREEIRNLVAQIKQAPALEASRLAKELSKAVEKSQVTFLDQVAVMGRSAEEAELNRSAETFNRSLETFLLYQQELDAVLKRQAEYIQSSLEEMRVGAVGAEIAESQRKLLSLVENEGQLLKEISGRLAISEKEGSSNG